ADPEHAPRPGMDAGAAGRDVPRHAQAPSGPAGDVGAILQLRSAGLTRESRQALSVKKNATAAAAMTAVAVQPRSGTQKPATCPPMIFRFLPTSITSTMSGGARSPLSTAARNRTRIGLVSKIASSMPAAMAPAKTR